MYYKRDQKFIKNFHKKYQYKSIYILTHFTLKYIDI